MKAFKTPTSTGKIGRLPSDTRNWLCSRLQNGEPGKELVKWLNGMEEVQNIMKWHFGGKPITEQNLSEWKNRGYQDWLRHWEIRRELWLVRDRAKELDEDAKETAISDLTASLLAAELAVLSKELLEGAEDPKERWGYLREAFGELRHLRRQDHERQRTQIERERWGQKCADRERLARLCNRAPILEKALKGKPEAAETLAAAWPDEAGVPDGEGWPNGEDEQEGLDAEVAETRPVRQSGPERPKTPKRGRRTRSAEAKKAKAGAKKAKRGDTAKRKRARREKSSAKSVEQIKLDGQAGDSLQRAPERNGGVGLEPAPATAERVTNKPETVAADQAESEQIQVNPSESDQAGGNGGGN